MTAQYSALGVCAECRTRAAQRRWSHIFGWDELCEVCYAIRCNKVEAARGCEETRSDGALVPVREADTRERLSPTQGKVSGMAGGLTDSPTIDWRERGDVTRPKQQKDTGGQGMSQTPGPDRLREIEARAEGGEYRCREHWGEFDADDDVRYLLAALRAAQAQRETLVAALKGIMEQRSLRDIWLILWPWLGPVKREQARQVLKGYLASLSSHEAICLKCGGQLEATEGLERDYPSCPRCR